MIFPPIFSLKCVFKAVNKAFRAWKSLVSMRAVYNSKLIIMATSLETNAVIVTRVHCTH